MEPPGQHCQEQSGEYGGATHTKVVHWIAGGDEEEPDERIGQQRATGQRQAVNAGPRPARR